MQTGASVQTVAAFAEGRKEGFTKVGFGMRGRWRGGSLVRGGDCCSGAVYGRVGGGWGLMDV